MLYNIYRPTNLTEIKGQDNIILTLKKQAATQNFGHAYLFAGHRGTGKTTIARIISKAVNCLNPSEAGPCRTCENCLNANSSLDILELDAASNNGVDKIKELISQTKFQPIQLPNKVYIIDEVHNLSTSAFDALLKTLEEPPSYCIFILCTTELHKIPVTILSRCELYEFQPISENPMRERLQEVMRQQNITCEEDALNLIIRHANGGLRDALSILEQLMISTDFKITTEATQQKLGLLDIDPILDIISSNINFDTQNSLYQLENLLNKGKSVSLIIDIILTTLVDMITLKCTNDFNSVLHSKSYIDTIFSLSKSISFERLYWISEQYCELRNIIRGSINQNIHIKLCIMKITNKELIDNDPSIITNTISSLKQEISLLKEKISQITHENFKSSVPIIDNNISTHCTESQVETKIVEKTSINDLEGGMPISRTVEDTKSEPCLSSTDLFKILGF